MTSVEVLKVFIIFIKDFIRQLEGESDEHNYPEDGKYNIWRSVV